MLLLEKQVQDLTNDKQKLHDLALNLLGFKRPYPSYPIFLWERYYLFQLKAIIEEKPYIGTYTCTFLDVFSRF